MQLSSRAACVVIIGLGLVACAPAQTAGPSNVPVAPADAARWTIAAHQVDCVGVGPMKCLRYRDRPGGPWLNFYDQIEGFNFQPGVEVDLLVRFITVERPPADGSSRRVVAVRELDRRPVAVSASLPAALTATPWQVSALPGRPLNSDRLTLSFDETGRVSGHAGVNRYSAAVSGDAAQLRVSQAVVTRMAGTPEAMALESDFLGRLNRVAAWRAQAGRLSLLDGAGAVLMELRPTEPGR